MKCLLLTTIIAAALAGCTKKPDPAPAPFLGNWQADSESIVVEDAAGQVTNPGATNPTDARLEVTATTMQFSFGGAVGTPTPYIRNGEVLTLVGGLPGYSAFARALTATAFTYELRVPRSDGSAVVTRIPYHR